MRINEAIYSYIDSVKTNKGLTLDQIATEARRYGATWTPGFISGMKRNASGASLFNMLILIKALESLSGESLVLSDLFPGDGDIELDGESSISREELRKALDGKQFELLRKSGGNLFEDPVIQQLNQSLLQSVPDIMANVSNYLVVTAINGPREIHNKMAHHSPTLSEQRAAAKVGITPSAISAICLLTYGRFLDEETARRAGENASPQKRGRETRLVIEEIDQKIDYLINDGPVNFPALNDLSAELADRIAAHPEEYAIAANRDPNKEIEREGGDGR
ncbi:hypothetical protein [Bifidobacterium imperatoris]|uniref:Uncharacterized protein n=1 Tax=Bifidobacterium imperatoris TaxID=2020965 RepID=A0A2N5IPA1_9BIFI|nr:hypothetical protein [Bifidobacterium imperatoris]PLS23799.1 hypothetical protein Tam1G_2140 [Bifidobacterium imperatoris]